MAQRIKQGNIFGRIGTEFGRGLAESIPKEIERTRLAQGLEDLNSQSNLTNREYFTRALSVPGLLDRPQVVQSLGQLAREQGAKEGFKKGFARGETTTSASPNAAQPGTPIPVGTIPGQPASKPHAGLKSETTKLVEPNEVGQPQVVPDNPTNKKYLPAKPWTPEEMSNEIGRLAEQHPNLTYPEIRDLAKENEQRFINAPEAEKAQLNQKRETQDRLRDKFKGLLELKLQKEGKEVFGDISGPMQNNIIRGMERDIVEHPNRSEDDVVNTWTERALDLAKANTQLKAKGAQSIFATPILLNKEGYRKDLEQLGEIYKRAGNSEEFYNQLQELFGMSPIGAASIAYARNKNIKSYISNISPASFQATPDPEKNTKKGRSRAVEIERLITPQDSILGIVRDLMEKDPYFDKTAFVSQLIEDQDQIGLTERQRRELGNAGQFSSSWGDLFILPFFRSIK